MNKEKKNIEIKEADDRFGNYVTDITQVPNIDSILGDKDKIDGILEKITFVDTAFGKQAIFIFNETKLKTSSEIIITKFMEALTNNVVLPKKATIIRKEGKKGDYYDIY